VLLLFSHVLPVTPSRGIYHVDDARLADARAVLQVVVPFQCSLAEASKTMEGLASAQRKHNLPSGVSAIETSALGELSGVG